MHSERISYLLQQYLDNSITEMEGRELAEILLQENASGEIARVLETIIGQSPALTPYEESQWEPLLQKVLLTGKSGAGSPFRGSQARLRLRTGSATYAERSSGGARGRLIGFIQKRVSIMAAAAILLLIIGGGSVWLHSRIKGGQQAASIARHSVAPGDVAPGSNRAVLTLANGATINLGEAKNGLLAEQGNSRLVKQKDGQLAYTKESHTEQAARSSVPGGIQYNLLTTPRGGQYQLVLPDGSKVWLNAASSLKYPTTFTGKERVVELEGEAYFEIAKNPAMPFRVSVAPGKEDPMQVEVLGTHFNIKAYADDPTINTTLLEGSVAVHKGGQVVRVRPGERTTMTNAGTLKTEDADTEEAIAWKNGLFKFNEATIEEVMRQVSRWYDVEVVYVNGAPKDLFRGEIYRNVNVSKVLKVLEASGVHFTVEGKKILVQS